jgi:hypothetical protein
MSQKTKLEQEVLDAGDVIKSKKRKVTKWGLRTEMGHGTPGNLIKIWNSLNGTEEESEGRASFLLPHKVQFLVDNLTNDITNNLNKIVQESNRMISDISEERLEAIQYSNEERNNILKQDLEAAEKIIGTSDQREKYLLDEIETIREHIKISKQDEITLIELTTELKGKNDLLEERELLIQEKNINFSNLKSDYDILNKKYLALISHSDNSSSTLLSNVTLNS